MSISKNQVKKEKLKELIWYITKHYNQELYMTKLWKLLFFCDSDYYQKYGESLTGVEYIKNKLGPTPYYNIGKKAIDELISNKSIAKVGDGSFVAIEDYELKFLDTKKIDAIKSTCEKYFKLNTGEICTLAHRDPVYLAAENYNDRLDFSYVAYRDDGEFPVEDEEDFSPEKIMLSKSAKANLLKFLTA